MIHRNKAYNVVDVTQLQSRIQNAIIDADLNGMAQCSVSTTNRYAVQDAIAPFQGLGYDVYCFQREGTMGKNLVWLPRTEIVIKFSQLGSLK